MKTYTLILSRRFPKTHNRAGKQTNFVKSFTNGKKVHTFRDSLEDWEKKAELINSGKAVLSVRMWIGRPYFSPQLEIKQLHKIDVQAVEMVWPDGEVEPSVYVDGRKQNAKTVAANDGMSYPDFLSWFFKKSNSYRGVIIQFTNFKY